MRMGGAPLSGGATRRARDSNVAKSRRDRAAIGEYPARTAVRTCEPTCVRHAARLHRARGACRSTDRACDPMPEHDGAADTSRAPDERIDPLRFRRSICMTNEIDVAPPLADHDRLCHVRRHGAAHRVHRVHATMAHPVSVVAAIAPHRRRGRFPIKKITRGLLSSRLRHTPGKTSAPHRTFHRRNVGGLPNHACPARTPRETGFPHRTDVTHRFDRV